MNKSLQMYMQVKKVKSYVDLLRTNLAFSSSIKCMSYGQKQSNLENFFLQRSISLMAKKCLWSDLTFTSQVRRPILPYAQQASRIRKKKKVKKRRERRVPSIPVCSLLMIMVNCAFSWIHKEASKAKGEHDPNFPSSVLLAFLLQTSASCSLQWYARAIVARWLPSAAWRCATAAFSLHVWISSRNAIVSGDLLPFSPGLHPYLGAVC